MITCLLSMERWIQHVQARPFDLIPVNRWSRAYKIETIRAAAFSMDIWQQPLNQSIEYP